MTDMPFLPPAAADAAPVAPPVELPPIPPPPTPDVAPLKAAKRPTTRAGREAAAAAKAAKGGAKPDTKPKPTTTAPRKASLESRLAGSIATLGTTVAAAGMMLGPAFTADGVMICERSAEIAKALNQVAQDQPQVKAALERMLTAGVYSSLIAALLPLVVGIAANHGALPPTIAAMFGAPVAPPANDLGGVDLV